MAHKNIRRIPRWLYAESVVPINDYIKLPPDVFRNDSIWPFNLEYLTISGIPVNTSPNTENRYYAGLGPRVDIEIGISGESDINLVPAQANAVMSHSEPFDLKFSSFASPANFPTAISHRLRYPYRLPRDSGFAVNMRMHEDYRVDQDTPKTDPFGVMFHGVDIVTGMPVMLGGTTENETYRVFSGMELEAADLFNRGQNEVDIHEIVYMLPATGDGALLSGLFHSAIVNPIVGERWMPGSDSIPFAHLAPLGAGTVDPRDIGPQTYFFPEETKLNRRQQMGVRVVNPNTTYNQPVSMALFGYLEVQ